MNLAAVPKRLHDGSVQEVDPAIDRARNGPVLEQEQIFDSARGSSTQNLLHICRSVTCSNLLVEPPERAKCRPGGNGPNQVQRLLIHFLLTKMPR
jgi:hypothetical protein